MTKNECASALQHKSFREIFELTENFLTGMQQSGLFLAFCPDKKFFHVLGAHTEIIEIVPDQEDGCNIRVLRNADGRISFKREKPAQPGEGGELICLNWEAIDERSAGFVLSMAIACEPVKLQDDYYPCTGIVFSRSDIK